MTYIAEALRRLVIERAGQKCEYCALPDAFSFYPHEIDHVVALKHLGQTVAENLAYACWRCNRSKGSDLGSFDPHTGEFSFLFNPRQQSWDDHFRVEQGEVVGLTAEGRTTVTLLKLNLDERVQERLRYLS